MFEVLQMSSDVYSPRIPPLYIKEKTAVANIGDISELWQHLLDYPRAPIGIDTETTGLDVKAGRDVLRGVSIAIGERSWYLPVSHPDSANIPVTDVARVVYRGLNIHPHAYHHWKGVDALVLERDLGVPMDEPPYWDTMVGAWLINENEVNFKLKDLCARRYGEDAKAEQRALNRLMDGPTLKMLEDEHYDERRAGITRDEARRRAREDPRYGPRTWAQLTAAEIGPYAARDAELTLRLRNDQREELAASGSLVAVPREMRWQMTLYRMECAGIRVNEDTARRLHARAVARASAIETGFRDQFGIDIGSTQQLRGVVYGEMGHEVVHYTPGGSPSVDREALDDLAFDPRIGLVLEWRRLDKARSTYYEPLLERLDPNGRIHPSFNSDSGNGRGATRTGRLACSNPNLMTIPREDRGLAEVRACFEPAPGHGLWEYDLRQAEVRMAAAISRDEGMCAAFADPDRDLYDEMAGAIGCPRQVAKTVALAYQYGGGADKLAKVIAKGTGRRPDPGRALTLMVGLERSYPGLVRSIRHLERLAREEGRVPLPPPGRYRHFRGAGWVEEYRKAFNSVCQGSVAEFLKDLQMEATPDLEELGARVVLQVHDSLVIEVPPARGEWIASLLQRVADDTNPYPWVRQCVDAKQWR
jgi:DNA polymerase I-like protein with 3'-5' exonuclease and polymerase domains